MGIEPTYLAWKASVLPLNYTRKNIGVTGFEPAASWSQIKRSSQAEPHPGIFNYKKEKSLFTQRFNETSGIRTPDNLIKSQVLYQLS